ncbi:ABC transporter ATP-binding protein [Candidatus Dependentiae bacterium Noda2021]|nr:ABC transporter ATP-binding protein [Candidatus Dependentiae bacterium Noda2021]
MIIAQNIQLSFAAQPIFDHISFTINQDQKIGLVGRNGSGKSTLLKAIAGYQELNGGSISVSKNKKIAYMPQDVVLNSSRTILQETLTAFEALHALMQESVLLEKEMAANDQNHTAAERYCAIQLELAEFNPVLAEIEAKKMLLGLGFKEEQFSQPVQALSTGWKMRIILAKLLLSRADFYLFDEPTNHLDILAKDWFMQFLKDSSCGFLLVCHERHFLDAVCTEIIELEHNKATHYAGNYSSYEAQKEHALELLHSAYEQQQKELKRKQETINKFRAGTRAKAAQSMMKSLDKIERITIPPSPKDIAVSFPPLPASSKQVLTVKNISYGFDNKKLFSDVSFEIERGEKVAIVAPNGAGKTTLFNVLTGKYQKETGSIVFGHNVTYALFDQDQQAVLQLDKSIIDNINASCPKIPEPVIRNFLGAFLFSADEIRKKVGVLSGGEKNRVGMVRVLLQNANLLFLDEPTNHLDISSKELLLKALKNYQGTIIFVSHDRSFVNSLATRILELSDGKILSYQGNYDDYLQHKKYLETISPHTQEKSSAPSAPSQQVKAMPLSHDLKKKSKALERSLEKTEAEIKKIEARFADLVYGTPAYSTAQTKLVQLNQEYDDLMKEWELILNS